jgi:cytidine deaminase
MAEIKNISFSYLEYDRIGELEALYLRLIDEAKKAAEDAYAPYSGFRVGAAVLLESGKIIRGSNVENAAYPSGICAERTALSYSVSNFPGDRPSAIAIAAMNGNNFTIAPVSPCGNCRQMIIEEELRNNKQIKILLYGKDRVLVIENAASLLPLQFNKETLKLYHP